MLNLGTMFAKIFGEGESSVSLSATNPLAPWLKIPRLHTLLPYESYDPHTKLYFNRGTTGFVLLGHPLAGATLKDQGQLAEFLRQDHNLPEGCSMQFLLHASPKIGLFLNYWRSAIKGKTFEVLADKRYEFLKEKAFEDEAQLLLRDYRVIISYTLPGHLTNPIEREHLCERRRSLQSMLEHMGMPTQVLEVEGFLQEVGTLLNFRKSVYPKSVRWSEQESLAKQIIDSDMSYEIETSQVKIGQEGYIFKSYLPQDMPRYWSLGNMDRFLGDCLETSQRIPCPYFIHLGFIIDKNQGQLALKANARRESLEQSILSGFGKLMPDLHQQYAESSEVITQIQKKDRFVTSLLNVGIYCPTEQAVMVEQKLHHIWNSCGWRFHSAQQDSLGLLLSSLPMMWTLGEKADKATLGLTKKISGAGIDLASLGRSKRTLTKEIQNTVPLVAEWKGIPAPGLLLSGQRGQIFTWSPFGKALLSETQTSQTVANYNAIICGAPGAGKSFTLNEMVTTFRGLGVKVRAFDRGRSLEKLCKLLGGQHVEFKISQPLSLNPFTHIPTGDSESDIVDRSDMLEAAGSVLKVMAAPNQGTTDLQKSHLDQALQLMWQQKKNHTTITDIRDYLLSRSEQAAHELAQMLYSFTRDGKYGRFFEGPATIDFSNDLVMFETENLEHQPDLMAVVVQMMIMQVNQMMAKGDRQTPFAILIDEAWKLLLGKDSAQFFSAATRTARKYKGSIILATQHLTDYFKEESPAATEAFKSSTWKLIMYQEPDTITALREHPQLKSFVDEEWKEQLLRSIHACPPHYSEIALFGPNINGVVGRLRADPFTRLLYSTNPNEYQAIQNGLKRGLTIEQAIEAVKDQQDLVRSVI